MFQNQDKVVFLVQGQPKRPNTFISASIKTLALCLGLMFLFTTANAQVSTVSGPSDATTAAPVSASAVNQIVTSGGTISMKTSTAAAASDVVYQWYKIDATGTKRLVQSSTSSAYTETATGAGYYTYQLMMTNANQCSSEISDPFKVYVLPALSPSIAASSATICSNGSSTSTLTANTGANSSSTNNYAYTYQWLLNGTAISGATAATYTTLASSTGSNTYSVRVAYALSPASSGTANQVVNAIAVPAKPSISVGQ